QDWARLELILLSELNIDYTAVMGPGMEWPRMSAADFVAMMSRADQLGNPLVSTQHLLGGSSWQRTGTTEITGVHQIRAAHIRYAADQSGNKSESILGIAHSHAVVEHLYRKDGNETWKLAGVRPTVLFNEGNLSAIFDVGPR
ncbi:NTF2-like protein, partial [Corynespora cassiicola Philippines]